MTRCKCSHNMSGHYEQRGKWLCNSAACGCVKPRPDTRVRHDRHDDLEPWRGVDMGAHHVDVWPDEGDV